MLRSVRERHGWYSSDTELTVADPGFPKRERVASYFLAIFPRKLHENERNWTEGGPSLLPTPPPPDPSMATFLFV